jgi:hypothetical protein
LPDVHPGCSLAGGIASARHRPVRGATAAPPAQGGLFSAENGGLSMEDGRDRPGSVKGSALDGHRGASDSDRCGIPRDSLKRREAQGACAQRC